MQESLETFYGTVSSYLLFIAHMGQMNSFPLSVCFLTSVSLNENLYLYFI